MHPYSGIRPWLSGVGLLILMIAVVFWWGAVVGPMTLSLIFPQVTPWESIPTNLDPDQDGTLANTASALVLLMVAILACLNVIASNRRKLGRVVMGGWLLLSITAILLAAEDFNASIIRRQHTIPIGGYDVHWMLLASPFIAAFLVALAGFIKSDRLPGEVRALLALGTAAWLLSLLHDLVPDYINFRFAWITRMVILLEETLEVGGTILMGLGAVAALGIGYGCRLRMRHGIRLLVGSSIVVVLAGSLVVGLLFRAPFADARARNFSDGMFYITLENGMNALQELQLPDIPIDSLDLKLDNQDERGRSAIVLWRIFDESIEGEILREGRLEVESGEQGWNSIEFDPPVSGASGRRLILQLVTETEPGLPVYLGATKANLHPGGRLWVNGEITYPDQDVEFVAFSAAELTRSKIHAIWLTFTSDWIWLIVFIDIGISLIIMTLIPLLVFRIAVLALVQRAADARTAKLD